MKVLIWILCIFVNALITTIFKESGIILGGIPTIILYGVTIWLARTLCKKWDERKTDKTPDQKVKDDVSSALDTFNETQATTIVESAGSTAQIQFCRKCGERLVENSRFCRKCGTEFIKE